MIIGIDLGTTNSLAAYLTADGPRLIPNALGEVLTPSMVGIDLDGQVLVGRGAREFQVLHPDRCAATFKRNMGAEWSTQLADKTLTAVELSSLVLKSLKADAEAYLKQPITEAVITVPAYFNELQRKATMRAGKMAGLDVRRILNEPTAAAIAYGVHETDDEKIIVIYDLGGGTFDVSVLERYEGTLEIRASAGEIFLGGEDFTNTLAARILEQRGLVFERAEIEQPLLVSRLRRECELAKRQLSRGEDAVVRIPTKTGDLPDDAPRITVKREEFERWTEPILSQTDGPLRRALGDARLKRQDVDEVILVGGATRMRAVKERVARLFEKEPRCSLNPEEVVALGAAIQAGLIARDATLEDLVVTDVAPFTLGVEVTHQFGGENREGYFLPIINRNTTIPVSRSKVVGTVRPNQTTIQVSLYQGENRRVEGNLFLGEFEVEGIPRGPAGESIEIRFTYDLNGVLEVDATIVATKKRVSFVVTKYAKGLSDREIAKAILQMQALKTHPRDETANRYVLRWAERVYRELPLHERQFLERLICGFEEAMELHDQAATEANREELERFLKQLDDGFENSDESF
ncbi:MAG: Heat shock protein 70 [Planctomycetaceae bacterium]|nr:Heat shock protein 70 [Planctomycetaceae bacterium]